MKKTETREPQYQICLDNEAKYGPARFGLMSGHTWRDDPKRLLFVLSRYKFVAKMLSGKKKVLEVGCADAFGTRLVRRETGSVAAVDFDPVFIENAKSLPDDGWTIDYAVHDILRGPFASPGGFDAAYSLDVIEHIPKSKERRFMRNIADSLREQGVLIIGTPSANSQVYASTPSREGHVNCKDHKQLKKLMSDYFQNVFIFS
ncbi:MAG TPA: class I SAM-dependent methyltransferase, partial [bacterium]|nr:class I SAM-dependent methyltransferase [bacterium]